MVNVLRRFSQPLMVLIAIVVIISFAWWGPNLSASGGGNQVVLTVHGRPYLMEDFKRANSRLLVHGALQGPYAQAAQAGATSRDGVVVNAIVLDHELDALGITSTEEDEVAMMKKLPAFRDAEGNFDPRQVDALISGMMAPYGFSKAQLSEFLSREVRVEKLRDLLGATVAVTPDEVRQRFIEQRLKTEASYIEFLQNDFMKDVTVTEDEMKQRYEAQKDVFSLTPETRTVRFAAFVLPEPADGKPLETTERTKLLGGLAQKAYDLANKLAEPGANFEELATAAGAAISETPKGFDREDGPDEIEGSPDVSEAAFALTKEKPFSKHLILQKGAYVLMLKDIVPPATKPYESEKPAIEATMKFEKAADLARAKAAEVAPKLAEAKKAGKSFYEAAESLGLKPIAFPAFSGPRAPGASPYAGDIPAEARKLAPGEISDIVRTEKGAILIHLDQRPAVDEKGIEESRAGIASQIQMMREFAMVGAWLTERRAAAGVAMQGSED